MRLNRLALGLIGLFLPAVAAYGVYCGQFGPPAPATTCNFFVAASGGSDSNAGTLAAPFATLTKLQTTLRGASSKIGCLRSGSYSQGTSISLTTADNGETWTFYPPDGVDNANINGGGTADVFTFAAGTANITINGFTIQNCNDGCIWSPFSGTTTIIENNIIFTNKHTSAVGSFNPMVYLENCQNCTVSHNVVHDTASQGIALFAFSSGESLQGDVVTGNVVYNTELLMNDGGAIYMDERNTNNNAGTVQITNNYVYNYGTSSNQGEGIYLDDDTSNVTVSGNVIGPVTVGAKTNFGNNLINGGDQNTFVNNLFDMGTGATRIASAGSPCAVGASCAGGNIGFTWTGPNTWRNNIVIAKISAFSTNCSNQEYCLSGSTTYPSTGVFANPISTNAYHNFGTGGNIPSTDTVTNDANPQQYTAAQIGVTCPNGIYQVAGGSTVTQSPVNFTPLVGGWGPPGYVILNTNHSC